MAAIPMRPQITNPEGVLVCQSCKLGMPFKLLGGDYFFETVECVDELSLEHLEIRHLPYLSPLRARVRQGGDWTRTTARR